LLIELVYKAFFSSMNVMNKESVSFYTINDNSDIVNNKYVIASTMVGVVITLNPDLKKVITICIIDL